MTDFVLFLDKNPDFCKYIRKKYAICPICTFSSMQFVPFALFKYVICPNQVCNLSQSSM